MFPEGTRQKTDAIGQFKKGFLKLALDAGCEVVPVVSRGAGDEVREINSRARRGRPVDVIIGKNWTQEDLKQPDVAEKIRDWFVKGYEELKGFYPAS